MNALLSLQCKKPEVLEKLNTEHHFTPELLPLEHLAISCNTVQAARTIHRKVFRSFYAPNQRIPKKLKISISEPKLQPAGLECLSINDSNNILVIAEFLLKLRPKKESNSYLYSNTVKAYTLKV